MPKEGIKKRELYILYNLAFFLWEILCLLLIFYGCGYYYCSLKVKNLFPTKNIINCEKSPKIKEKQYVNFIRQVLTKYVSVVIMCSLV